MNKKIVTAQQIKRIKNSNIVMGTLILTFAGFVIRVIGFFYRIFLSKTMGAELMGIYQLIFPVFSICFTIFATGLQTAISRLVASEVGKGNPNNIYKILGIGMVLSLSLASLLSILLYVNADFIAWRFLLEERSAPSLRLLAIVFPFCGITSCINGYYYGFKKAGVPAATQLIEQILRVASVYVLALFVGNGDMKVTCEMAVIGVVAGEIASSIYNLAAIFITKKPRDMIINRPMDCASYKNSHVVKSLMNLSVPLSANRLLLSILHSIEAILIPAMLRRAGLSIQDALVAFGVLNGMSIPFIMFPTALTNALAVLLLPTISEAQATKNNKLIAHTTAISIKYSLIIGVVSTGLFVYFGRALGTSVFHNQSAGDYLVILAWLCPFFYLTTTLSSIINGLGKAHITFINSVVGTLCKIFLIIILIPLKGINGYLIALLIGQLIITGLDVFAVTRYIHFYLDNVNSIIKPGLVVTFVGFFLKKTYDYVNKMTHIKEVVLLLAFCFLLCAITLILLMITKTISKNDFK